MLSRILGVALCLAPVVSVQGQEVVIQGIVVDAEGQPVEGASVATTWLEGRPATAVWRQSDGTADSIWASQFY